jgi:hypothetical protein
MRLLVNMAIISKITHYILENFHGTASVGATTTVFTNGLTGTPCRRINSMYITNNDASNVVHLKVLYTDHNNSFAGRVAFCARIHPNETVRAFTRDCPLVVDTTESFQINCVGLAGTADVDYIVNVETFKNAL